MQKVHYEMGLIIPPCWQQGSLSAAAAATVTDGEGGLPLPAGPLLSDALVRNNEGDLEQLSLPSTSGEMNQLG